MIHCVVLGALPLLSMACDQAPTEDTPTPIAQEQKVENGITFNGITFNGITFNGITFNGITFNGMSPGGLADPATNKVVEYLVGCALPQGDQVSYDINGQTYTFAGKLGLAPEWRDAACGTSCQRWVSACMMARVNSEGQAQTVSLRGAHVGLTVEPRELQDFPMREATYYGNIFALQPAVYACLSPGQTKIKRVCGDSLENCPLPVVGSCDDVCQGTGRFNSFRNCSPQTYAQGAPPASLFSEAITVFLPNE